MSYKTCDILEPSDDNQVIIGLFGTCGHSKWRDEFVKAYDEAGIAYFNPNTENWTKACAEHEAFHLKRDNIILLPLTNETFGSASVAEVAIACSRAQEMNNYVILMMEEIHQTLKDEHPRFFKEANNARNIVLGHLKMATSPNVFVVDNLQQMLAVSLKLHQICTHLNEIRGMLK